MEESRESLRFEVFTLFPGIFSGFLSESILNRALERGLIKIAVHNIRDFASDPHRTCDDTPYGGGGGMILKPEPIFAAAERVLEFEALSQSSHSSQPPCPIVLLTPQGRLFSQEVAEELSQSSRLALICGRYEGVDERVRKHLVTDEISIGDFVLGGGEVPAMVLIEAVSRLMPGVLGWEESIRLDSHTQAMDRLLEGPHFTRPSEFRGLGIPEILVSGHHAKVAQWRRDQSLLRTAERRPELLLKAQLSHRECQMLQEHGHEIPTQT